MSASVPASAGSVGVPGEDDGGDDSDGDGTADCIDECPDDAEDYGEYASLVLVGGLPRVAFYDRSRGDLKLARGTGGREGPQGPFLDMRRSADRLFREEPIERRGNLYVLRMMVRCAPIDDENGQGFTRPAR